MLVLEWLDGIVSDVTCCCMWLLVVTRFAYLLDLYTIHIVTQLVGVAVWCSLGGYNCSDESSEDALHIFLCHKVIWLHLPHIILNDRAQLCYVYKSMPAYKSWHFKILPPTFSFFFVWGIIPFLSYQLMFHYAYLWKAPRYLCFTMFMWLFCLFTLLLLLWLLKAIWLGIIDWLTRYRGHIHI